MWSLILHSLRYRLGAAAVVYGGALFLALAVNILLPVLDIGPTPEDDFHLLFFFPVLFLFAAIVFQFGNYLTDMKERRMVRHILLPKSKLQVGLARMMTPVVVILLTVLGSWGMMYGLVEYLGKSQEIWRFLFLAFFAGQFIFVMQFPMLVEEVAYLRERGSGVRYVFIGILVLIMTFLAVRGLTPYIEFDNALVEWIGDSLNPDPETLETNLVVFAGAALMTTLNLVLFMRRKTVLAS